MIVVTGGAGFIGSCLVRELNNQGHNDILIVDQLGHSLKWKNLVGKQFSDIVHKTVFRQNLLAGVYGSEIEAIIHLGACSATTELNADYLLENNYEYSKDLAIYAEARNIRFVYASSAATYGAGESGYNDLLIHELQPLNMYGYSKHLFDVWVIRHGFDKKFVGLKFFNVFGPNEYHKGTMASLVFKAFHQVRDTKKLRLFQSYKPEYSDGEQQRDFVYVKDITGMMVDLLQYGEITGIINMGTGVARSWNDLAKAVFLSMNMPVQIEYIEMPEALQEQYQYYTCATMEKLINTRIYRPFQPLEHSVMDYIQQHLSRQNQYY